MSCNAQREQVPLYLQAPRKVTIPAESTAVSSHRVHTGPVKRGHVSSGGVAAGATADLAVACFRH